MRHLVFLNGQSREALACLVQAYNLSTDGKDDLIPVIKLLRCATKSIIAMRLDTSSGCQQLPDLYVKHMLKVLQTSSVAVFTHRIKQYDDHLEFQRYQTGDRSNSPKFLSDVFKFALGVHTKMRHLVPDKNSCCQNQSPPSPLFTGKIGVGTVRKLDATSTNASILLMKQNVVTIN